MSGPNPNALVKVAPRPRGRLQTRRRGRAPIIRRRRQRSSVHAMARLNQESSSCSSIERMILQSVFRFPHESSICYCRSPEQPLLRSMARNDSSSSSPSSSHDRPRCRARGPAWHTLNPLNCQAWDIANCDIKFRQALLRGKRLSS